MTGRGDGTQGKPAEPRDYYTIDERLAPTCAGNGLNEDGILCGGAVNTCPAADQIRFWIWHQRTDYKIGPPPTVEVGPWVQEPGTFCLGPDDPGVPNIVTTLARAQDLFEERIRRLAPPKVKTSPGPRTLVNYETQFEAQNATPFSFAVTLVGTTVHLDVRPTQFTWTFGDGTTESTTSPTIAHTYRVNRTVAVRVDIEWGGTFTVGRQAETYAIDPPATVAGTPGALTVVTARAENVSR